MGAIIEATGPRTMQSREPGYRGAAGGSVDGKNIIGNLFYKVWTRKSGVVRSRTNTIGARAAGKSGLIQDIIRV